MISFPRLIILPLLAIALHPLSILALAEPGKSGSPSKPAEISPTVAAEDQLMPQPLILSMKAAIAMAVRKNIDLRIEGQNTKMASVESIKSRGIYNPVLNVSGTGGVTAVPGDAFFSTKNLNTTVGLTQNLPTGGSISASTQAGYFRFEPATSGAKEWQSTAGLAITQPLLRNAGKETFELNITLAAATLQDSLERFRAATSDTVSNVITAYNRLYVLRQVQETREASLSSAQTLLTAIKKKESGSVQNLEIANAEFAIAQRRKDFVEAARNVMDQETNLRYLIGLEAQQRIVPSDPPSKDEPQETDEQAVKAALDLRSDLKQLRTSLDSARLQERVALHQSLPELSVNASGGFTGTGYNLSESYRKIGNNPGTYWSAGMLFSVPLGNTTAHNEHIKSKIRVEQAQDQVKSLSWKIRNEIENDMRALISARLQIQLADKSSQFAEQRYEQYRQSSLLNLASIQDLINADNDLNIARNSQLEAVETFSNAVTKLWKDTGLLLDHHGIHVDKSKPEGATSIREQEPSGLPTVTDRSTEVEETPETPAPTSVNQSPIPLAAPAAKKTYTLTIGEFTNKAAMVDAVSKIEIVGLTPQVKEGPQRTERVIRLYMAEFSTQLPAQKALKKVQLFKGNGFIQLNEKKHYVVYAGSFLDENAALKEQTRLATQGIKVRPEKTSVSFVTSKLSAGNFLGQETALKYAKKLEQLGLKAVVTETP